ncbi:protein FAR1-related sequence 5, partial [Tanacetum coccineum]
LTGKRRRYGGADGGAKTNGARKPTAHRYLGGAVRSRAVTTSPGKRQKNTSSRLINCPLRLTGKRGKDGLGFFKPKNLTHSHYPSTDISGHPSFRKLKPDNIQIVKDMTLSRIPPRQILSSLHQQNPNIPATSRTIYNVKKKFRKDTLEGRSEINALFEEFEKGGFLYDVTVSNTALTTSSTADKYIIKGFALLQSSKVRKLRY